MPWSRQYSTTPVSSASLKNGFKRFCTDVTGTMAVASRISSIPTLDSPTRLILSVLSQLCQRAHAVHKRDPRVGRMQLVQIDAVYVQGSQRSLASCLQVVWPGVSLPSALGTRQAPFRRQHDAVARATPAPERLGEQPLIVPDVIVVEAVDVRCIQQHGATLQRAVNRPDALGLLGPILD